MLYVILITLKLLSHDASLDPALAIAQAWEESRFDPHAVSRVVGGRRVVGRWTGRFPDSWSGPYFCGIWQVEAYTQTTCQRLQSFPASLQQWRTEMRAWLRFCRGDLRCALAGYGCGVAGARRPMSCGGSVPYHRRVLRRAERYRSGDLDDS